MINKEVRIVVASMRGFTDMVRTKLAVDALLQTIYLLNEGIDDTDPDYVTPEKIVFISNGEQGTIAHQLPELLQAYHLEHVDVPVDWATGKAAFYENCVALGSQATYAIIFWDHEDQGMNALYKSCLQAGAPVRSYNVHI